MRAQPEWRGKTDDTAIPPRVQERVARKAGDRCQKCTREVGGKLRAEIDHIIPLIIGGEHRERNLQLLCNECHAAKTKLDVKLKARVAKSRLRKLGIRKPSGRPILGSKASGWKRKMNGAVERRT